MDETGGQEPVKRETARLADLPVEEVARLMDKREGAVKALQHRALASLRRHLARAEQQAR